MFETNELLLEEAQRIANLQPDEYTEVFSYTLTNVIDSDVLELVKFIASGEEQYQTISRV